MWFIAGLIIGAVCVGLIWFLKIRNYTLTWYEWLLSFIGIALLLFTIQNFFASLAEIEDQAASLFLLVTGIPSIIILATVWQLSARRIKSS